MDFNLASVIGYFHDNPIIVLGCAIAIAGAAYLLQRKPAIQKDADQRLAALRRENAGRYDRLRSLE